MLINFPHIFQFSPIRFFFLHLFILKDIVVLERQTFQNGRVVAGAVFFLALLKCCISVKNNPVRFFGTPLAYRIAKRLVLTIK